MAGNAVDLALIGRHHRQDVGAPYHFGEGREEILAQGGSEICAGAIMKPPSGLHDAGRCQASPVTLLVASGRLSPCRPAPGGDAHYRPPDRNPRRTSPRPAPARIARPHPPPATIPGARRGRCISRLPSTLFTWRTSLGGESRGQADGNGEIGRCPWRHSRAALPREKDVKCWPDPLDRPALDGVGAALLTVARASRSGSSRGAPGASCRHATPLYAVRQVHAIALQDRTGNWR